MPEPGVGGGAPIFWRSVNPVQTEEGRLSPPITTGTSNVFHLPASLHNMCAFVGDLFPYILFKPHVAFEYGN